MHTADIVFCPYNYIVDPVIRRQMDLDLRDAVVVLGIWCCLLVFIVCGSCHARALARTMRVVMALNSPAVFSYRS